MEKFRDFSRASRYAATTACDERKEARCIEGCIDGISNDSTVDKVKCSTHLGLGALGEALGEPLESVVVLLDGVHDHGDASGAGGAAEALGEKDIIDNLEDTGAHLGVDGVVVAQGTEDDAGDPAQRVVHVGAVHLKVHRNLDDGVDLAVLVFVDGSKLGLGVVRLVDLGEASSRVLALSLGLAADPAPDGLEEVRGHLGGVLRGKVADGVHDLDADVGHGVLEEGNERLGSGLAQVGLVLQDLHKAPRHLLADSYVDILDAVRPLAEAGGEFHAYVERLGVEEAAEKLNDAEAAVGLLQRAKRV